VRAQSSAGRPTMGRRPDAGAQQGLRASCRPSDLGGLCRGNQHLVGLLNRDGKLGEAAMLDSHEANKFEESIAGYSRAAGPDRNHPTLMQAPELRRAADPCKAAAWACRPARAIVVSIRPQASRREDDFEIAKPDFQKLSVAETSSGSAISGGALGRHSGRKPKLQPELAGATKDRPAITVDRGATADHPVLTGAIETSPWVPATS